ERSEPPEEREHLGKLALVDDRLGVFGFVAEIDRLYEPWMLHVEREHPPHKRPDRVFQQRILMRQAEDPLGVFAFSPAVGELLDPPMSIIDPRPEILPPDVV